MSDPTEPLTPPWAYYRRTGLSEMRPYVFDEDLTGISVSEPDLEFMSICAVQGRDPGGYIARNPKNHADQWYVAQAYFDENLEPADTPARDDAAELRALLNHPLLNKLMGELEDHSSGRWWGMAEEWMDLRDAALAVSEGES